MFNLKKNIGALFGILIDPEKHSKNDLEERCDLFNKINYIDFFLLGGTYIKRDNLIRALEILKCKVEQPVFLFPGLDSPSVSIVPGADGVICPIVLGSIDSYYLFGWHHEASKYIEEYSLKAFPFGYLLVRDKENLIIHNNREIFSIGHEDIKKANEMVFTSLILGISSIYLEAGSGSKTAIYNDMIFSIKNKNPNITLTVGGGLKSPEQISEKVKSGADIIIIGNAIEDNCDYNYIKTLSQATKLVKAE